MLPAPTSLAKRVRSIPPPVPAVRWLQSDQDAEALRNLIRACYGQSYSYADLYRPGGLEEAWRSGALISMGEFVDDGSLRGHTGFWAKDPTGDALESGLSLVDPKRRRHARANEKRVWNTLREGLAPLVSFVHQHTTTLHPMAQRYALRHMHARPSGLIPFYACGESVLGLEESGADMHALCMTTLLRPDDELAPLWLPLGPWHGWLSACADALALDRQEDERAPDQHDAAPGIETIELNEALGLRRRRVSHGGLWHQRVTTLHANGHHRVELVHVSAVEGITAASRALHSAGFVPCGVHPRGGGTPHDIVFVHAPHPARLAEAVRSAKLATPDLQQFWATWCEVCERIS